MSPARSRWHNSFDGIRLIAAFLVFYDHELGLTGLAEPGRAPINVSLGTIGVWLFLATSGYLVTHSLLSTRDIIRFGASRILRIYPGLLVNLIATILLFAFFTEAPLEEYLLNGETLHYFYSNILLLIPSRYWLPGVFTHAHWGGVNSSLWTIRYECLLYVLIALPVLFGRWRLIWWVALALLASSLARVITARYLPVPYVVWPGDLEHSYFELHWLSQFSVSFFTGAALAVTDRERPLPSGYLVIVLGLFIVFLDVDWVRSLAVIAVSVATVELGKSRLLAWYPSKSIGDVSYGVYLYSFPIQNLFIQEFYDGRNLLEVGLASLVVVLALGLLSWHVVEKRALSLKRYFDRRTTGEVSLMPLATPSDSRPAE
jgi:peptidoglycan/LPS O-acetylase OafA/YrhL